MPIGIASGSVNGHEFLNGHRQWRVRVLGCHVHSCRPTVNNSSPTGTELAHLAHRGVPLTLGVDRSIAALIRAHHLHPAVQFVQADVRQLPFPQDSFDVVLGRGCFHYLQAADRPRYAAEVDRVLRPDGRFLLRACLYAQGIRNDLTEPLIRQIFTGWRIVSLEQAPIPSDTRQMIAFVTRMEHPGN